MKKLTFTQRLWLPLLLSLVALLVLSIVSAYELRSTRLEEREKALSTATDIAMSAIDVFHKQAESGAISERDAKEKALSQVRAMHYAGTGGYLVVIDADVRIISDRGNTAFENKDVSNVHDHNGVYMWRDAVRIASTSGAGFLRYEWPKPNTTEPLPKLSIASAYAPWHWTILTGVYIDDLNAAFYHSLWMAMLVFVLVGGGLAAVVAAINASIVRSLGGTPEYAATVAATIARGDLSEQVNISGKNESSLLGSISTMQSRLAGTLESVKRSAQSIAVATAQIAAGNHDLAQRTEEQAAAVEQSAASLTELLATVESNAANARDANDIARKAATIATTGREMVDKVENTMLSISTDSKKIGTIVAMIEGIAFQTNILALNAAVEAARAGEEGRGFAVVASEVRSLAQRSSAASKDIRDLIEASVTRVREGSHLVTSTGETIRTLSTTVESVTHLMGNITTASEAQSRGVAQVSQAIGQMDQVTQQNAALVEQASAAASSLEAQTKELSAATSVFQF
jgi:methyl-accepting chemotaxis protein